jgi:hypothetical protein
MSNDRTPLRRNNQPPERSGPKEEVVRIGAGEHLQCCVLSTDIEGFFVHWDDRAGTRGRSRECLEDKEQCQGCQQGLPVKWLGYVDVLAGPRGRVFIEMPPECARLLKESCCPGESLRGLRVVFRRTTARNGRLRPERLEYTERSGALPESRSAEQMLRALWSWQRK